MTSDRKIRANRANAQVSTGPKTADGRARAVRNAFRHGLSLPVCSNPALSEEVEALAREIAGPDANAETQDLARQVAEAQIDLRRVRYARHELLLRALDGIIRQNGCRRRPVAAHVRELMADRAQWTGSASDFLQVGINVGGNAMAAWTRSGWPKSARALAGRLRRALAFLAPLGLRLSSAARGVWERGQSR